MKKDLTGQKFSMLTFIKRSENKGKWDCLCDCGKIKSIRSDHVTSGRVQSCGCSIGKDNLKDITGFTFGKLFVISLSYIHPKSGAYWTCLCDCGNTKTINGRSLRNGRIISCGCVRISNIKDLNFVDISGNKYNRVFVISYFGESKWNCVCDCGKEFIADGSSLKNNYTKSCGCLADEMRRSLFKLGYGIGSFNALYLKYRRGAKKRNLVFDLDKDFFCKITKSNCYYCGVEPKNIQKSLSNNGDYVYNGIDRVDNNLGYIYSNVVPCCSDCNFAKKTMSEFEFLNWVDRVYNFKILPKIKENL